MYFYRFAEPRRSYFWHTTGDEHVYNTECTSEDRIGSREGGDPVIAWGCRPVQVVCNWHIEEVTKLWAASRHAGRLYHLKNKTRRKVFRRSGGLLSVDFFENVGDLLGLLAARTVLFADCRQFFVFADDDFLSRRAQSADNVERADR